MMVMKVVDGTGLVAGRLASRVAKMLLEGERITVVNAEKIVVTGNPKSVLKRYAEKRERGDPIKGPFYPRTPDRMFRRMVRGMLPYKKPRGREAYRRLKVYIGSPVSSSGENLGVKSVKDLKCKYVTLGEICRHLGWKG